MRFLCAILCVCFIAWAASGQSPKYTVKDKTNRFTVVNKTEKPDGPWNNPSCSCENFKATTPCPCSKYEGGCKRWCFPFGNGAQPEFSGVIAQQAPVTVCQNGVCGVVSPQSQFSSCANGSCSGGTCSGSASGGWYPGKLLGRRR